MKQATIAEDWFASAFNALYPVVYAHRTIEAAAPEAEFAARHLALAPCDRVLDLACGNGRHMVHLLRHSARVMGLDYSADLLRLARAHVGGKACLIRGDMRALPFRGSLDAICNFFTSFGYFSDPAENAAAAREIARALRPGGRFFIDHVNEEHLAATLAPESERRHNGFIIHENRWIDPETRRVNKRTRVYSGADLAADSVESVQLYTLGEMRALLAEAGLRLRLVFGDYDGAPHGPEQPRMILIGDRADSA